MKPRYLEGPRMLVCLLSMGAAAACSPDVEPPVEQASSAVLRCPADSPVIDLSDVPIVFAINQGQSASHVLYQGIGLDAGTIAVTESGVRLDLADLRGAKPKPAASIVLKHQDAALDLTPAPGSELDSTTTFVTPTGTIAEVPNHASLSQRDLYPGIDVAIGGTLRMLVTTYTVAPSASLEALQWTYAGATDVSLDRGVGSASILVADGARTLSLGPPEAHQMISGEPVRVEATYTLTDGTLSIALGDHDPSEPVVIETRLLHSPVLRPAGTTSQNGAIYAAGRGYHAASGDDDTLGDAYVAVLSEDGSRLDAATFLIGGDDDEAEAVSLSSHGEILLAGRTRSLSFPTAGALQPDNAGGTDGFVARLDATGASLLQGTYLGSAGEDAATGIAEDPSGAVLVVSTLDVAAKGANVEAASFVVSLPAPGSSAEDVPYSITALGADLSSVTWVAPVKGRRIRRPRLWIACNGRVHVGVRDFLNNNNNPDCDAFPDLHYEMYERLANYVQDQPGNTPDGPTFGWGFHALRWKFHLVNDTSLPGYTPTTLTWFPQHYTDMIRVTLPDATGYYVNDRDYGKLNRYEYSPYPGDWFFQDPATGAKVDPRGTWEGGDHADIESLSLKAALIESHWKSPVYTTKRGFTSDWQDVALHPMVVEQTFIDVCVEPGSNYGSQGIEQLCDFPDAASWFGDVDCAHSGVHGVSLSFELQASSWNDPAFPSGTYLEHFSLATDPAGPGGIAWYKPSDLIYDPPAEELQANAKLDEAAARLAGLVTARVPTLDRDFQSGKMVSATEGSVIARSLDLH